ncbi:sacsin N-terminal ATP-binding-like domain-containing protein [Nocardioides sp. Soil796]|uniref:sacsin N-terminal ATP-binding-like domain-containing protein n=1 Tax=Nocardioides sp. Soil796 TaxID=1736412 RepID=UPI000A96AD69|nr:helicase-related protein [Nocardioides sp. Soil796]
MTDLTSWLPDSALVAEVDDQFRRAIESYRIHPDLIAEHANLEESIRTGGYANRTLLELVQNAADALAGPTDGDSLGRVEIVLDTDSSTLYCANGGRPFSKSGLTAITMAHLSGKRGDEIGRFGLGFKSVLAVSDAPQVLSRSVAFQFNSEAARAELAEVGPAVKRYPILRTATVVDAADELRCDPILTELGAWATTIVKLPDARNLDRLHEEIEAFASEFLLFVSAVREVRLRIVGNHPYETIHLSRDLGNGHLKIERPDGDGDEWIVQDRMHRPSLEARHQVGEAVSREQVKVTVAVPTKQSRQRIGEFWSYFPLQDKTSASALFNAPWSVNDDRTTLLKNDYNREILRTVSDMFVDLLPRVRSQDDPAAHLDYMPARGRETLSFGDELLTGHLPLVASKVAFIPDAHGTLRHATELKPLDFEVSFDAAPAIHRAWIESPNTRDDVPSWRCYATPTRVRRLRDLFVAGVAGDTLESTNRDTSRALEAMPKRGLLSWLKEWADGTDPVSSAHAFKVVCTHPKLDGIARAKVIPTSDGLRSLSDHAVVFVKRESDIEVEGGVFVEPAFLSQPDVERLLRQAGFRDLDPEAILNARLAQLGSPPSSADLTKLWDAVLEVPVRTAVKTLASQRSKVQVPTVDGFWSAPDGVFDLDVQLGPEYANRTLDRQRCMPAVAHQLGVIQGPVKQFAVEDELAFEEYRDSVLTTLNAVRGPGERSTERIEFTPGIGPGPMSVLGMLRDAGASESVRVEWTNDLLVHGDADWVGEDLDTGRTFSVVSPARWAVESAGLVRTTRGSRQPSAAVSASMVKYEAFLPLFRGPAQVADALRLPSDLANVPAAVLREAVEGDIFPTTLTDATLVEFLLEACPLAYPAGAKPPRIPARIRRVVESRAPSAVYLATTDEQQAYLATRDRPHIHVDEDAAEKLVALVGCRRFEESFTFSMRIEGQQDPQPLLDLFTGLRGWPSSIELSNVTLSRASSIEKWVTTEDGVEPQSLDHYRDGVFLVIGADVDDRGALRLASEVFDLGITNAEIDRILKVGLEHHLELIRQEALAADTDTERLEVYFGDDDLREKLPKGLWQGLEAQGLVSARTSVAELCLSVYGKDTVRELADLFRRDGFPDVPDRWAGLPATITWLRRMGFGAEFAGQRGRRQMAEFVVPGATILPALHDYQSRISEDLRSVLRDVGDGGRRAKAMVELPTGAGKTRVASQTVLQLFIDGELAGPVLWIAQSQELCEQAVQTFSFVWRGLCTDQRVDLPLTIGRLWEGNDVHQPDTDLSVIVATDAQLDVVLGGAEFEWLSRASAVFVDEGHVAGNSARYTRILSWLGVDGRSWDRPLVGLSATPFKGTSKQATDQLAARFGRRKLNAFEENAYQELVSRGVLARVKHKILEGAKVRLTDAEASDAKRLNRISGTVLDRVAADHERMAILVQSIMDLEPEPGRSVLVFTPTVLSAQVLAATLRFRGVEAASVSGQTGRQERRDVIDRFKNEGIQVLANCELLTQGFDAPGVTALYIARPTFSPNAYIQMAGRGLRGPKNGGKDECLIVDMADNFGSSDINNLLGFREYEELWQEQQT